LKIEDFEIKRPFNPKFLGMKEEDIDRIEYWDNSINWYDKDNNHVYYERKDSFWWVITYDKKWEFFSREDSNWNKIRVINWKNFEYMDWKYYYDNIEMFKK
jgi:hypothetical protein